MNTYQLLFLLAFAAAAVPIVLALFWRDNYDDNEGMSVEDWKKALVVADSQAWQAQ